jgi:hypothetical protein
MAVAVDKAFRKSQKAPLKLAMSGKPMHFAVMAAGSKKGKFVCSKKPGEVKPKAIKEKKIFDESGKDSDEAKKLNGIEKQPAIGVCTGDKATKKLTLYITKGGEKQLYCDFATYFISKILKIKTVKEVLIQEVEDESQFPQVDENAKDPEEVSATSVTRRIATLREQLAAAGGNEALSRGLDAAASKAGSGPEGVEEADEELDEIEAEIGNLAGTGTPGPATTGDGDFTVRFQAAESKWTAASSAVSAQMKKLQAAMKSHSDADIKKIADSLDSVTDGFARSMEAALKQVGNGSDPETRKKAAKQAVNLITTIEGRIKADKRIKVCDDNPFDVKDVQIQKTLEPALTELKSVLEKA